MKYVSLVSWFAAITMFAADANAVVCARYLPSRMRRTARRGGCASHGSGLRMGQRQTRLPVLNARKARHRAARSPLHAGPGCW
jgi:hypothetical protein